MSVNKINYMQSLKKTLIFLISSALFFSCGHKHSSQQEKNEVIYEDTLKYAKGFSVKFYKDYTCVSVFNQLNNNQLYEKYYLCKNSETTVPEDGIKVLIPLKTIAVTSCTHFEFLDLIGEIDKITGVCEPKRIYNPKIRQKINDGKAVDLGDALNIEFERLLRLKPNAVMISGSAQQDESGQRMARAGLTVIYNNEWMEESMLARAEWIKFVAAFFDKSTMAAEIFNETEKKYAEVCKLVENVTYKPTILTGNDFRGAWYVPGGKNYAAELYEKAGGDYFYRNNTTSGSIPLSMEAVLKHFIDADVWLGCSMKSMSELESMNERYALFKAFKTGNVYNDLKRSTPSGGNDYWESAVAHPDIVLQDVIKVLHPDLLPNYELFYLQKLE